MLEKFRNLKVFVVGDAILDEYVYGKVERISPEAPVPILHQSKNELRLGGAANVAANCVALGASTTLFSIAGDDQDAALLEQMCEDREIYPWLLKSKSRHTPRKTRFVANNHQMLRVDKETKEGWEDDIRLRELLPRVESADVVIVSDYNKGCVTKGLMDWLRSYHSCIIVDPKPVHVGLYEKVKLVTPNKAEAAQMLGVEKDAMDDHGIESLVFKLGANVLVTLGEEGMKYCASGEKPIHFPAITQEVCDVTGAGDTVVSVISLAIGAGIEIKEACKLANKAAAQVVAKFGTATVDLGSLDL